MQPKLKRLRKLKGMASLPMLNGRRKRAERRPVALPKGRNTIFDATDDVQQEIARALKDEALSRRVTALLKQYPYGTLPELVMLDYLQRTGTPHRYQVALYGGYKPGGIVPDIVVSYGGTALAILVNGNFWHQRPGQKENDASDKARIIGQYVDGEVITGAVIIWESVLLKPDREQAMANALAGIEMPP